MAEYYIAPKSSFDATADAIREKTGSQATIEWTEDGFADAIEDIPTGGGGYTGYEMITHQLENTDLVIQGSSNVLVPNYAFSGANITSLTWNDFVTKGSGNWTEVFANCTDLVCISFPNATRMDGIRLFSGCTSLVNVVLPKCGTIEGANLFQNCTSLKRVDLGSPTVTAVRVLNAASIFANDSAFDTLILRQTSVGALYNINAFSGTPFASDGTGGTLYVPADLVSSYQSATNWSTVLAYTNNQIKSIESTHTDPNAPIDLTLYYADGTPIE